MDITVGYEPASGSSILSGPAILWGCSSVGRAIALQAKGRRFDSVQLHHSFIAGLAQLARASAL